MSLREAQDAGRLRLLLKSTYGAESLSPSAASDIAALLEETVSRRLRGRSSRFPLPAGRRFLTLTAASAALVACLVVVAFWTGVIGPLPPGGQTAVEIPPEGGGTPIARRLEHGTIQEAERAVGYSRPSVGYLPDGAVLEGACWSIPAEGAEIWLSVGYAASGGASGRCFSIRKHPAEGRWSQVTPEQASKEIRVRGLPTEYDHVSPEPGDNVSAGWTTIRWVDGEWCYVVEGDLDLAELLKVAEGVGL